MFVNVLNLSCTQKAFNRGTNNNGYSWIRMIKVTFFACRSNWSLNYIYFVIVFHFLYKFATLECLLAGAQLYMFIYTAVAAPALIFPLKRRREKSSPVAINPNIFKFPFVDTEPEAIFFIHAYITYLNTIKHYILKYELFIA